MAYNVELRVNSSGFGTDIENKDRTVYIRSHYDIIDGKPSTFPPATHQHNASDINAGTLHVDRIPAHDASKINSGVFGEARIPSIDLNARLYAPSFIRGGTPRVMKALFDTLRPDRTAFLPADQIIIEESTDGGTTWVSKGATDSQKRQLFTGQRPTISLPLIGGVKNVNAMIRVTITAMKYTQTGAGGVETARYNYWNSTYVTSNERYCTLDEGWIWVNATNDNIWMRVERATGAAPNTWTNVREAWLSGWSGGNYFTLDGQTFGGGTTQTGNGWNWRFTFRTGTTAMDFDQAKMQATYTTSSQAIFHLKLTGANVWTMPNKLMYHDHLYGWDENQNAEFPADVKAAGTVLVKTTDSRLSDARASNDVKTWAKDGLVESYTGDMNALVTTGFYQGTGLTNAPTAGWYFYIVSRYRADSNWVSQIAMSFGSGNTGNKTYTRMRISGVWSAWVELYSTGNKPPLSELTQDSSNRLVTDAEKTAWNAKLGSFTETDPTVPAWAKATNKPSYTYSEVGAAPATFVSGNRPVVTDGLGYVTIDTYANFKANLSLAKGDVGLSAVPDVDATNPANIVWTASHRSVTDTEKSTWNGKQNALGFTPYNATNPSGFISAITKAMVEAVLTGAITSHSHGKAQITNFDSEVLALSPAGSRPASDVYAWAKAASKPSYTAS
jgi:hypothetical protein